MVAIKSLAVLLFAVAAAAGPVAGEGHGHGNNVDIKDSSIKCGKQEQKVYCCNDDTHSKAVGQYTGVFNGLSVKCDTVPVNVLAVDAVSAQKQCSAGAACCTSESDANGVINLVTGCVAPLPN